jgi:ubiquinone/menaquinone biosynthesis C-methylase UbiE
LEKNEIFRDTKNWYLDIEKYASPKLIDFAVQNAGKKILDLGCATGDYSNTLKFIGYECTGVDINPEYIEKAREKGIDAYVMKGDHLEFPDNSFDTVLLFEVLEHLANPYNVLKEAKRVAKQNILITVPNCTQFTELKAASLTYDHMLEEDHINFFTKNDLENLISRESKNFKVEEDEPIELDRLIFYSGLPRALILPILLYNKIKTIKSSIYYRLYAVVEV